MASPQFNPQNTQNYDPIQSILYTLPDTGAVLNVNSLPENVVDGLIAKYGAQGPLLGRKNYLEQTRLSQPQPKTEEQLQDERMAEYQKTIGDLFGKYRENALNLFNDQQAGDRGKLVEEQVALGGSLRDPARQYGLGEFERNKSLGLSSLLGELSGQEASGQMDLAKTIENIRSTTSENAKNRQLQRDTLTADINNANENRGLSRYLADANARQQRDLATPDEWTKQLGRINGLIGVGTSILTPTTKAYNDYKGNQLLEKYLAGGM